MIARPDPKTYLVTALSETEATINGDGEQTRDFTFVADVVSANLSAMRGDAGPDDCPVFNVGTGARISVNELWKTVCEVVGTRRDARHGAPRPGDVRDSLADISRARAFLGYVPRFSIREGFAATMSSYPARTIR